MTEPNESHIDIVISVMGEDYPETTQQMILNNDVVKRLNARIKEVKTNYPIIANELQLILNVREK